MASTFGSTEPLSSTPIFRILFFCFLHQICVQSSKRAWSGRKRERALRPGSSFHLGRGGQSANSVKLYKISSWEPEEASFNLPCLLILAPSWMLGLPSPTRPSWRRRRGGHCANRPFCHSDGARDGEERITWRCAAKRSASSLLRDALQPFLGAKRNSCFFWKLKKLVAGN